MLPEIKIPRSVEWYVIKSFAHKWGKPKSDGTIYNWKDWERHCGHFTVVEIKANEMTELTVTHTKED